MAIIGWLVCLIIAVLASIGFAGTIFVSNAFYGKIGCEWLVPFVPMVLFWWLTIEYAPFVLIMGG